MDMTEREKFIALVGNDLLVSSDAIVLLEGDGFSRLAKCAELFHENYAPVICFSGGAKNSDYGSFPFEMFEDKLADYNLTKSNFIVENLSRNTQEQAIEIIKIAKERYWTKIILVASNFHQYRAYLTFLQALNQTNTTLVIMNAPARNLPWFEVQPWGQRFELLDKEFEKIEKYTALGHIANFSEAIAYQKWKEQWILAN